MPLNNQNDISTQQALSMQVSPVLDQVALIGRLFHFEVNTISLFPTLGSSSPNRITTDLNHQYRTTDWLTVSYTSPAILRGNYDAKDAGFAYGVDVSQNYMYVANLGTGLKIVDISNSSDPFLVGSYSTAGGAENVVIRGNYAYVAEGNSGLQIINIASPSAPTLVGAVNTPGSAQGIVVFGNYSYIADGFSGLQIIDISSLTSPMIVGAYSTIGDWSDNLAVAGHYAYVGSGSIGLVVIDITNPATPIPTGIYDSPGYAQGVAVAGNSVYLADGVTGLIIIDVSNPATPTPTGICNLTGNAIGVTVSGNYAYVADGFSGLQIINIADPKKPRLVETYDTPGESYTVAVSDNYAYVADRTNGVQLIELTTISFDGLPHFKDRGKTVVTMTETHTKVSDLFNIKVRSLPIIYFFLIGGALSFASIGFLIYRNREYIKNKLSGKKTNQSAYIPHTEVALSSVPAERMSMNSDISILTGGSEVVRVTNQYHVDNLFDLSPKEAQKKKITGPNSFFRSEESKRRVRETPTEEDMRSTASHR